MSDDANTVARPELPDPTASNAHAAINGPRSATPPTLGTRYILGEEIARGGMGAVLRATDTVLNREVAVKVLHEKYAPTSGAARRFDDEARITGQLQHPNIPAVHDLGILPDGRPFLAMKLIKGQTLESLLKNSNSSERGRFIAVFEQICQALAYAHAHEVIHRDLKPANIMVGAFGEVQVMDWGLAKLLLIAERLSGESDPESTSAETEIKSMRDSEDLLTQAGSVLGTPAYMPPEQAIGAVTQIDTRSDVFGLGGILCVILTGKAPYSGADTELIRQLAAWGKLDDAFARLDASQADPDLVALCKRCLAFDPNDRPKDAREVAGAVAKLRAEADERARQAEIDRATSEVQSEERRKRRRLRTLLVTAIGLFLVVAGATGWWIDRQNQEAKRKEAEFEAASLRADSEKRTEAALKVAREEALNSSAQEALAEVDKLLRNGKVTESRAMMNKAEGLLAIGGSAPTKARAELIRRDLEMLIRLEDVNLLTVQITKEGTRVNPEKITKGYEAAFRWYGIDLLNVSEAETAAAITNKAIRRDLVAGLWGWINDTPETAKAEKQRLLGIINAADPLTEGPIREFVEAQNKLDGNAMATAAGKINPAAIPPGRLLRAANNLLIVGHSTAAISLLRKAQVVYPTDFLIALDLADKLETFSWGNQLTRRQSLLDALAYTRIAALLRPDDPAVWFRLGSISNNLSQYDVCVEAIRRTIELRPNFVSAHLTLAEALKDQQKDAEAETYFKRAVELQPNEFSIRTSLGNCYIRQKKYVEAESLYLQGRQLQSREISSIQGLTNLYALTKRFEDLERLYKEVLLLDLKDSDVYFAFSDAFLTADRLGVAEESFFRGLQAMSTLSVYSLSSFGSLASAYTRNQQTDQLTRLHDRLQEIYAEVCKQKPKNAALESKFGDLFMAASRFSIAEIAYRRAVDLESRFAPKLTLLLFRSGKANEAIVAFTKASESLRNLRYVELFALSEACLASGQIQIACDACNDELIKNPSRHTLRLLLGYLQIEAGNPDAINTLKEVVRSDPALSGIAGYGLGRLYTDTGELDEAISLWGRMVQADPSDTDARFRLADAYRYKGRFAEAAACYEEVMRYNPSQATMMQLDLRKQSRIASSMTTWSGVNGSSAFARLLEMYRECDNWAAAQAADKEWRSKLEADLENKLKQRLSVRIPSDFYTTLEPRLANVLAGVDKPIDARERYPFGQLACWNQNYKAATKLFKAALEEQPFLAPRNVYRPHHAAAAARAGTGQGIDPPSPKEQAEFRGLALRWLRNGLAHFRPLVVKSGTSRLNSRRALRLWLDLDDFIPLREPKELAKLPDAERKEWEQFWREVRNLLEPEQFLNDLELVMKQPPEDVPGLLEIRIMAFNTRNDLKNLVATAEAYEKLATKEVKHCYNAACGWSLASGLAKDDVKAKEKYALRAMIMLKNTPTGKGHIFATPANLAAHMQKDTDMNPLRGRDDYKALVASLEANTLELAPLPREKK